MRSICRLNRSTYLTVSLRGAITKPTRIRDFSLIRNTPQIVDTQRHCDPWEGEGPEGTQPSPQPGPAFKMDSKLAHGYHGPGEMCNLGGIKRFCRLPYVKC